MIQKFGIINGGLGEEKKGIETVNSKRRSSADPGGDHHVTETRGQRQETTIILKSRDDHHEAPSHEEDDNQKQYASIFSNMLPWLVRTTALKNFSRTLRPAYAPP